MKTFFISDTHFFHHNIIKFAGRPFKDVMEMHKVLIDNWNSVVTPNDIVVHGGDFGWGPKFGLTEIAAELNGHKILVRGNHDGSRARSRSLGFQEVFDVWFKDGILVYHYPDVRLISKAYSECEIFLHGHIHEQILPDPLPRSINICVEVQDYIPKTIEQLLEKKAQWEQEKVPTAMYAEKKPRTPRKKRVGSFLTAESLSSDVKELPSIESSTSADSDA